MVKLLQDWKTATAAAAAAGTSRAVLELTEADFDIEELDPRDPNLPAFLRDRIEQRRREQKAELDLQIKQHRRDGDRKADAADDSQRRLHEWLASAQYQLAYRELCDDIADAKWASQSAYERALKQAHATREALEDARARALVVNGNRVYFTRDGQRLYGDGQEITDSNAIAAARRCQQEHPGATSYEDYEAKRQADLAAIRAAEDLKRTLDRLTELETRVTRGNLTPEELAVAQQETRNIVQSLPPDARAAYEQRRVIRANSDDEYRSAALYEDAPAFVNAPDLSVPFQNAAAGLVPQPPISTSQPGPKQTAKNTDDYRPAF